MLALEHAFSAKAGDGGIIVLDKASLRTARPRLCGRTCISSELTNALIIDGAELEPNFALAARNIRDIDVLPVQGINVYDILRRRVLVLTRTALEALEARLK